MGKRNKKKQKIKHNKDTANEEPKEEVREDVKQPPKSNKNNDDESNSDIDHDDAKQIVTTSVAKLPENKDSSSSSDDESSDEEDDDLVLEGVIVRNPEVEDSDDTSSEEEEEEVPMKKPAATKATTKDSNSKADNVVGKRIQSESKKKKKQKEAGPEIITVDFTFCDMDEKYFHGLKTLLTSSSPIYAKHSSALSDLMIENISVGTVVSTEGDVDGTVFGFASVLNVTTYQDKECIQDLKKIFLDKCPTERKTELETVLSGKTKRPAGIMFHARMVNMPLEVVEVLHQQLVLDMDWAVKNAEGGEVERKSLDFGAFVRMAPTYRMGTSIAYKYFDDEIFAQHAEFTFEVELPKTFGSEEIPYCNVLVMTKTGHRDAMKGIGEMVNGSTTNR